MKKIEVFGLQSVPEIKQGDNLPEIIVRCAEKEIGGLQEKDIVVLTSKIVSKADGLLLKMSDVKPGQKALMISRKTGKDAQWLQMIFDEGHEILAILPLKGLVKQHIMAASGGNDECTKELVEHEQALCITMGKAGRVHTCDAGIDGSNHGPGIVSLLPKDPDKSTKEIREKIQKLTGKKLAVILADTEVIPFGTIDLAVGSSGISPRAKMFGKNDLFGKPKFGGIDLVAYELTSASALVFGQVDAGIPIAVIRGYEYEINETENIANTLLLRGDGKGIREIIKSTMRATSYVYGWNKRLLLRIASWFI
jgi:coenzyme F420-0:L-glutamate ligase/coenzyme F420-1:gamma-L-glutamate ligase